MDGLLLTGGSDVSMPFLRQPVPDPSVIQDADPSRDAWEFEAVRRAVALDLPVLAICRGLQVLNVALGGTLHLDIPGHDSARDQDIQPLRHLRPVRRRFERVNSSHHQALAELAPGIEILALCATDGVVEEAWMPGRGFVLGTQFHPERGTAYSGLFEDFFAVVNEGAGAGRLCP
jgi:putative glutamine amidotransferase